MSRYTKQHYEDVAKLLSDSSGYIGTADAVVTSLINDFADLFAADNPPFCRNCDIPHSVHYVQREGLHEYTGGFNRKPFLEACGLEPKE